MNLPVVFGHEGRHVVGSSVRHFQSISIANLIKLVIFVKAFLEVKIFKQLRSLVKTI